MSATIEPPARPRGRPGRWARALAAFPPLSRVMTATPAPRSPADARADLAWALLWGALCHGVFAAAVLSMIAAMWFGMSRSFGALEGAWAWIANTALILQFPLGHSLLLTDRGRRFLGRLGPPGARARGATLAPTTYALIASVQLLLLFTLWSPSGIVWWRAEGAALWALGGVYAACWLLLMKASWDAGAEVQSGLLGWAALARGVKPPYPPMPTRGLFRHIRHPIYLAFALACWPVSVWTPDQLLLASMLTGYCLIGPLAKERRFARMFGADWRAYRARTPFWIPRWRAR